MTGARTAFVTTTSPLTVTLVGSTVAQPAFRDLSYTPVVADRVAVVDFDASKLLVVCKVG